LPGSLTIERLTIAKRCQRTITQATAAVLA
jgi:hypothetical protein